MTNSLLIKRENDILEIMFNRPESRNAITRDMFEQMLTTLEKCKEDQIYTRYHKMSFKNNSHAFYVI